MSQRFMLGLDAPRERLDKVLVQRLAGMSRATVQRWIRDGRVRVDDHIARASEVIGPGAVVEVEEGQRPTSEAEPDPSVVFEVVFEDPHLIVVNKPAGLVVHPARGHRQGTLVNGLLARPGFGLPPADKRDVDGALRPGIVHRIDKDTSGLLVVAKDELTREGLKQQFSDHSIERAYLAITLGVPKPGTIETLHGRHPKSRLRFTTRVKQGKRAATEVRVQEVLGGGRAALVECRLLTGRTHQVRVHLSEQRQTPIFGDDLYGKLPNDPRLRALWQGLGRHALHAGILGFAHPVSGQTMRFERPPPEELRSLSDELRNS